MKICLHNVVILGLLTIQFSPAYGECKLEVQLDKPEIVSGGVLTGIVGVTVEEDGFYFPHGFAYGTGGLTYQIEKPNGLTIEISDETAKICQKSGGHSIDVRKGKEFRYPFFLLLWDGNLIFDEIGDYSIVFRLVCSKDEGGVLEARLPFRVIESDIDLTQWRKILPNRFSVVRPFALGNRDYQEFKDKAIAISSNLGSVVDQIFLYSAGGGSVPNAFLYWENNYRKDFKKIQWEQAFQAILLGGQLAQKLGFGAEMWADIEIGLESAQDGSRFSESNVRWKFR